MSPHRSTDVGLHGSQSDVLEESFLGLQAWLPSAVNSQIKATKEALEDDIFNLQGKLDQAAKVSRTLLAPADWKSLLFWQLAGFDSADWE